jgi:hypothetical protein
MRVFSRISARVASVAMIVAVVGCGQDLGVGPDAASIDAGTAPSLHRGAGTSHWQFDKEQVSFVLNPNLGGTFQIGKDHWITFDPDAVCDPRRSSYGPGEWDKPCVLLHKKITITAKSSFDASGHPYVRLEPELRFAPVRTVTLWLYDRHAELNESYKILYCPWRDSGDSYDSGSGSSGSGSSGSGSYGGDDSCVDESLTDPSLATHLDMNGHRLYRRIKHFSYYNVAAD